MLAFSLVLQRGEEQGLVDPSLKDWHPHLHALGDDLPAVHGELVDIGLAEAHAMTISDVLTCPGADTCSIGVTSSKGLGTELRNRILAGNGKYRDPLVDEMRIKISGCPNSCGQHHVADIGFFGMAVRMGERQVPAFQLMLGGNAQGEGRLGKITMKIPARYIPDAVEKLVDATWPDSLKPVRDIIGTIPQHRRSPFVEAIPAIVMPLRPQPPRFPPPFGPSPPAPLPAGARRGETNGAGVAPLPAERGEGGQRPGEGLDETLDVPPPPPARIEAKSSGLGKKLLLLVVVLIAAAGAWLYWAH